MWVSKGGSFQPSVRQSASRKGRINLPEDEHDVEGGGEEEEEDEDEDEEALTVHLTFDDDDDVEKM